jgi:protein-S-isoprenylcysteine O-methyltransferase Ste14
MNAKIPPMFPIYAITNLCLVWLGYQAASTQTIPHRAVLASAAAIGLFAAFQWSRTLARAYRQEDRTFSMFQRLYDKYRARAK